MSIDANYVSKLERFLNGNRTDINAAGLFKNELKKERVYLSSIGYSAEFRNGVKRINEDWKDNQLLITTCSLENSSTGTSVSGEMYGHDDWCKYEALINALKEDIKNGNALPSSDLKMTE